MTLGWRLLIKLVNSTSPLHMLREPQRASISNAAICQEIESCLRCNTDREFDYKLLNRRINAPHHRIF